LKHFDIAIIGGGMVGASLALLLARANSHWHIALLEAQAFTDLNEASYETHFDARSTAIAQGSVDILHSLGVWEKLLQQATAISKVHVSDAGHFSGGLIDAASYGLDAVGYVIPNSWVTGILWATIKMHKNIHCFSPVQVQTLLPEPFGVSLSVKSVGKIFDIQCSLAVIADGGDSPHRQALGIISTVKNYDQTAVIANVAYTEPHNGIAYERFTKQGPLALLPLGGTASAKESALVLTLPRDQAKQISALSDSDFLTHLQDRFGFRLGKFERISQRYAYELKLMVASEQVRSHLVLVGNAAHFLHPVAGQGFNLSLRDCACLADSLRQGAVAGKLLGDLRVLQNYQQRQRVDQSLTIEFSDKLVRLFSNSSLPLTLLRHLGFVGLDLMPSLKNRFAVQTMGTAGEKYNDARL
jgi:2-polyprenylphenol 6-hydroxylase